MSSVTTMAHFSESRGISPQHRMSSPDDSVPVTVQEALPTQSVSAWGANGQTSASSKAISSDKGLQPLSIADIIATPGSGLPLAPWTTREGVWQRMREFMYDHPGGKEEADGGLPMAFNPSMPESYESVEVPTDREGDSKLVSCWRKLSAFIGPGYMVAVGYMDPGNWATDIAGGAQFRYSLLFIVLLSSISAMFLQVLTAKMGIVAKKDLAQACRDICSPLLNRILWLTAEAAIAATDLAEVIGSAIALELLIGLPLVWGVCLTALDVLLLLGVLDGPNKFRVIEGMVAILILIIILAFGVELALSKPPPTAILLGFFAPDATLLTNPGKLYIAIGIIGATIMPHNLYLHSSVVQTRRIENTVPAKREAILFSSVDTIVALAFALFVNAAILMVAAAAFYNTDGFTPTISQAFHMLAPTLGTRAASILFGIALLASGQNSTLTGTLAGQIVMEGFVQVRLKPWLRRLMTRLTVIVPAVVTVLLAGEKGVDSLLTLSQVILSIQLPFAVIPLVYFTSHKALMGPEFVNGPVTKFFGWLAAAVFVGLNFWLLLQMVITAASG